MKIETGIASVNGTELYYEVAGDGFPLVLIHGLSLDTRMWDDQFEAFATHYRVIRYDLRGYGRSSIPTEASYTRTDDLEALLAHLNMGQAHILGLSMGGGLAIDFALTHPDRTRTLIVVAAGPAGSLSEDAFQSLNPTIYAAKTKGAKAANEVWLEHPFFRPAHEHPQVSTRLTQIVTENSGWHWVNHDPSTGLEPQAVHRMHEIKMPTLVIMGERDEPYMHQSSDLVKQHVTNAQKVVIPHVGHMCNMEAPNAFSEVVLSFLQRAV